MNLEMFENMLKEVSKLKSNPVEQILVHSTLSGQPDTGKGNRIIAGRIAHC